jgi:hypothetical protein
MPLRAANHAAKAQDEAGHQRTGTATVARAGMPRPAAFRELVNDGSVSRGRDGGQLDQPRAL